jgi:phenylalanine-4-hydroxylase
MQQRYVVVCTVLDAPGSLAKVLNHLSQHLINIKKIESRKSFSQDGCFDIFIEFDDIFRETRTEFESMLASMKSLVVHLECIYKGVALINSISEDVPWFPRHKKDLDVYATRVLEFGESLDADHPGFQDKAYRARRLEIVSIAKQHQSGQPIPHISYADSEVATWACVFQRLKEMYPSHACREYLEGFMLLQDAGLYREDAIPQLEDVSQFLQGRTGFSLKPVMGLLSPRDFLNGLAFRVFHSTQYIRHASKPLYTPEPDVCHELLGHVPLFCDRAFAAFSQEIGLASLGASDAAIEQLASIYWFTIEFGLTEEAADPEAPADTPKRIRAYGAGLLSSFGELGYCLTDETVSRQPFDPTEASITKYPITSYQPRYFVAKSFQDAQSKIRAFSESLKRPFQLRYDAFTSSIIVLDRHESIRAYASELSLEFQNLSKAL